VVVGIAAAEHVMTSSIGWSLCGGAIGIALDKIKEEYDFSDFDFSSKTKWCHLRIGFCALEVLANFGWDIVSILYTESEIPYCSALMDSFVDAVSDPSNTFVPTIAVKQVLDPKNPDDYLRILQMVQQRSRVVIFCMDLPLDRRAFLAKASEAGMTTEEYVFIMFSTRSQGFGMHFYFMGYIRLPSLSNSFSGHTGTGKDVLSSGLTAFWEDTENKNTDGLDAIAKQAAKRAIVLDIDATVSNQTYMAHFKTDVVRRVREDPLFCNTEECLTNGNKSRGTYARQLHDTFYMFGMGLSREPTYYHDATNLTKAMAGDFSGLTGEVQMTENNTRIAVFMLYYLDSNFQQQVFMTLTYEDANINITLNSGDPSTTIWATRNGKK
uniref:ANF_receptor domain-containing protein n=1 Tax=Haemonchus contortus TaxID=6289 RepID=A0A7I5EBF7_HAECO